FIGPNPETQVTTENSLQNPFPSFITIDGPAREARFKFFLNRDGSMNQNMPDETILANLNANPALKRFAGISGHPNRNGSDGTISRFGWKAQNKSLEVFSGEAYNVEMGITNELFQNERASPDEAQQGGLPANCMLNPTPEDVTHITVSPDSAVPSDVVQFAMYMRFLKPPI